MRKRVGARCGIKEMVVTGVLAWVRGKIAKCIELRLYENRNKFKNR